MTTLSRVMLTQLNLYVSLHSYMLRNSKFKWCREVQKKGTTHPGLPYFCYKSNIPGFNGRRAVFSEVQTHCCFSFDKVQVLWSRATCRVHHNHHMMILLRVSWQNVSGNCWQQELLVTELFETPYIYMFEVQSLLIVLVHYLNVVEFSSTLPELMSSYIGRHRISHCLPLPEKR